MTLAALLKDIAVWRKQLTVDLASHNSGLDLAQRDRLAQEILDHAICLKICADRCIASHWHSFILQPINLLPTADCWVQLTLQRLDCFMQAHQLAATPIALLGYSYEQFLSTSQASNRKAQGAYYTPAAVIDYLVTHTLGTCLQSQTVASLSQVRSLRILDPACGGGAFLLRAYQHLLDWYQAQYVANFAKYRSYFYQTQAGDWQLTLSAKQNILCAHIYGVDIDQTAVELTKRSLLLQLLENSAEEELNSLRQPNSSVNELCLDRTILDNRICCGNALISSDFYGYEPSDIKPLDWEQVFPDAIRSGGFDVVIGNPPWLFTRTAQFDDRLKRYYQTKYFSRSIVRNKPTGSSKAKQTGKINLFVVFLFKFIELLHPRGRIGVVVPNTLLRTTVYENVRQHMLERCHIEKIVELGHDSFTAITASVALLMLSKDLAQSMVRVAQSIDPNAKIEVLPRELFLNNPCYVFSVGSSHQQRCLFDKVTAKSALLSTATKEIIEGIVCRKDQITTQPLTDRYQRMLEGKDITRYAITFREKYILFDRPLLHRPRPDYVWAAQEKIILRRIGGGATALMAALDTERYYAFASTNNILIAETCPYNLRYILALLNSKLLNYYYVQRFTNQSRLTVNIAKTFVEQLPIRSLNLNCPAEQHQHDRLVQAVDQIQSLHYQLKLATSLDEQHWLHQQIDAIDQQIDRWVYDLYELTETEIQLIKTPAA